jgi:hypothetical protein
MCAYNAGSEWASLNTEGLIDTGASVNVLPYEFGRTTRLYLGE